MTKPSPKKTAATAGEARVRGDRRDAVIDRGGDVCVYCGAEGGEMTVDHVVPRVLGGSSASTNLVCACRVCNVTKGDWELDLFAERLRRERGVDPAALMQRVAAQLARPLRYR